jgi:hypothetical protein
MAVMAVMASMAGPKEGGRTAAMGETAVTVVRAVMGATGGGVVAVATAEMVAGSV